MKKDGTLHLVYQRQYYDDEDNDITERATVPAALAAAAARRRQMEEDNEFGAGDEERDYQKGGDSDLDNDNNEEDDEDQNINPDYEQLKGLWMSELACPELLPADAETIAQNVEDLAQKEEVIDELLQRSKSQRQSRDAASGEVGTRAEPPRRARPCLRGPARAACGLDGGATYCDIHCHLVGHCLAPSHVVPLRHV